MDFHSASSHGFARLAAVTLPVAAGDPLANAAATSAALAELAQEGCAVAVFPELSLSGYSLDDLFRADWLLAQVRRALVEVARASAGNPVLALVGAPLVADGQLFNCALAIRDGRILRAVAKSYLPTYREFYEARYFASGLGVSTTVRIGEQDVPLGQAVFTLEGVNGLTVGCEICEDMWAPHPVGADLALAGANVIVNLSASPVTVGRSRERELMVASASARQQCAYVYTAAGMGESSTDLAWDGQTLIYQRGERLAAGPRFARTATWAMADVDLNALASARRVNTTFRAQAGYSGTAPQRGGAPGPDCAGVARQIAVHPVPGPAPVIAPRQLLHPPARRFPFVPNDAAALDSDCYEAYNIQVYGLVRRLQAIGGAKAVIGVSGGLDSTHALIVAARAMDLLGRPRSDILAYTLPGFATSSGTKNNAYELCRCLGIECREIDIRATATQMLTQMGHPYARALADAGGDATGIPADVYDVTFENVQAGLRTDYLFRIANQRGGIVVGTGDLSELALGWCTYGVGDHMSHYNVNCGVPKTLIQQLIRWVVAKGEFGEDASRVLAAILDTEISPELIPGRELQSTEDTIGPYELHDFFLHYYLAGYSPDTIAFLAHRVWGEAARGDWPEGIKQRSEYGLGEIVHWLEVFIRRFHNSQFKRTCVPNGPKVSGAGALSPRGDWRMPADVGPAAALRVLAPARRAAQHEDACGGDS